MSDLFIFCLVFKDPFDSDRGISVHGAFPRLEALAMDNGKDPAKFREERRMGTATDGKSHGIFRGVTLR